MSNVLGALRSRGWLVSLFLIASAIVFIYFFSPIAHSQSADKESNVSDISLHIDGIEGSSTNASHPSEIDVRDFNWGVENRAAATRAGGGGQSKATFKDFELVIESNKASTRLFTAAATGEHFRRAVVVDQTGSFYSKWTLTDVIVSSYQTFINENGQVADRITLNFAKVEIDHKPTDAEGPYRAGWNAKTNSRM